MLPGPGDLSIFADLGLDEMELGAIAAEPRPLLEDTVTSIARHAREILAIRQGGAIVGVPVENHAVSTVTVSSFLNAGRRAGGQRGRNGLSV